MPMRPAGAPRTPMLREAPSLAMDDTMTQQLGRGYHLAERLLRMRALLPRV